MTPKVNQRVAVLWLSDGTPDEVEAWSQQLSRASQQNVDWNYQGGRAAIWTTGDVARVQKAVRGLRPAIERHLRDKHQIDLFKGPRTAMPEDLDLPSERVDAP